MRGYEAIADALVKEGVECVFTVAAEDNMAVLVELKHKRGVRVVSCRKECGAAAMADGYSRATGKPGVFSVTLGPGLTNAATSLRNASIHRSPIICITTEPAAFDRHSQKGWLDQKRFSETIAGKYIRVRHAETLAEDIQLAFRHVNYGLGPVVLAVPNEFMKGVLDVEWDYHPLVAADVRAQKGLPDPQAISKAADIMCSAKRPAIIVGRGAAAAKAAKEIEALAERTRAALATTMLASNYLNDHPYNLGPAGLLGTELLHATVSESDCVVAVGCSLNRFTTALGFLFPEAKVIHIDPDLARIGEWTPVSVGIVADACIGLAALNRELTRRGFVSKRGYWSPKLKSQIAALRKARQGSYLRDKDTIDPRELLAEIDKRFPKDRIVSVDAGHFAFFTPALPVQDPADFIWSSDFAVVGMGLFQGIGAAVGKPDRHVVVLTGDGGLMMTLEELDTAVRERIHLTVVVFNDNAFGAELHFLEAQGKPIDISVFDNPDFAEVARSLGAEGMTVRQPKDMKAVAARVGKGDRPLLVDAKINPRVIHEIWPELLTGLEPAEEA